MPAPRMQGRHAVTDIWPSGRRDTLEWKWLSQAAFRVVAPESGNRGRETSDRGDEKGGKLPDQLQRVAGVTGRDRAPGPIAGGGGGGTARPTGCPGSREQAAAGVGGVLQHRCPALAHDTPDLLVVHGGLAGFLKADACVPDSSFSTPTRTTSQPRLTAFCAAPVFLVLQRGNVQCLPSFFRGGLPSLSHV